VLEAMATGLAVVSTDVGDVRAMVAQDNRAFVTPLDDTDLANALRQLLKDAPLRNTLGAANRLRAVLDFDDEAMFRAYAALLDGVDNIPDSIGLDSNLSNEILPGGGQRRGGP